MAQIKVAAWNPLNSAEFATIADAVSVFEVVDLPVAECGQLYNYSRDVRKSNSWPISQASCLEWRPSQRNGPILACGTAIGAVSIMHTDYGTEASVCSPQKFGKRCCNAVSWNQLVPSQLVTGFDNIKSEYCAMLWDLEHEAALKMSFGESASALVWLPESAHTLLVGTSMGWIKAYDTRMGNQTAAASIMAHPAPRPRKTRGIRADPYHPWLFCSFSDFPGDLVKVWDLRQAAGGNTAGGLGSLSGTGGSNKTITPLLCSISTAAAVSAASLSAGNRGGGAVASSSAATTISGASVSTATGAEAVVDVAWSPTRPYVLALVTSNHPCVSIYNIAHVCEDTGAVNGGASPSSAATSSAPICTIALSDSARSLSWQGSLSRMLYTASRRVADGELLLPTKEDLSVHSLSSASAAWESFVAEDSVKALIGTAYNTPTMTAEVLKIATGSDALIDDYGQSSSGMSVGCKPHHRLLAATVSGLADMEVKDQVPLALSTTGAIATAVQERVILGSKRVDALELRLADPEWLSSGQAVADEFTDCGQVMRRRCGAGYAVEASANIDILSEELEELFSILHRSGDGFGQVDSSLQGQSKLHLNSDVRLQLLQAANHTLSVFRTWLWIDRYDAVANDIGFDATRKGIMELMQRGTGITFSRFHRTLGTTVYASSQRERSKKLCGWAKVSGLEALTDAEIVASINEIRGSGPAGLGFGMNSQELPHGYSHTASTATAFVTAEEVNAAWETSSKDDVLEFLVEEFFVDNFERAAAVSLFHGRVDLAVKLLQKAIDEYSKPTATGSSWSAAGVDRADTIDATEPYPNSGEADENAATSPTTPAEAPTPAAAATVSERRFDWDEAATAEYFQSVSLVAMCLAGYNYSTRIMPPAHNSQHEDADPVSQQSQQATTGWPSTWISMCKVVMSQLRDCPRQSATYLLACCYFLLHNLQEEEPIMEAEEQSSESFPYCGIINNPKLALEDRIAFCCTFLSDEEVSKWLNFTLNKCITAGNLEGVMISGLSTAGRSVLQKYIDEHNDIQTAALLVCRSIEPQQLQQQQSHSSNFSFGDSRADSVEWRWLHEYRTLLNKWELFVERAHLDVELGKRARRAAKGSALGLPGSSSTKSLSQIQQHVATAGRVGRTSAASGMAGATGSKHQKGKDRGKSDRTMYRIPPHSDFPHFYLRCGSCSAALPVDAMQNVRPEALRTQKNILNCCANCGKSYLPKCYVCLLPMGMVNPYVELQRIQNQRRKHESLRAEQRSSRFAGTGGKLSQHSGGQPMKLGGSMDGAPCLTSSASFNSASLNSVEVGGLIVDNARNDDNVVDFGKWFFFCQHCRHGGHAQCIEQWWDSTAAKKYSDSSVDPAISPTTGGVGAEEETDREQTICRFVCGVNGCNCQCVNRM